jgi:clan AA aspartic protease (TIGR02281 family)
MAAWVRRPGCHTTFETIMRSRHENTFFQGTLFILAIITCLSLLLTLPVSAALYRWFDAQGQVHYSTKPPTFQVDNLEVKRGGSWHPYRLQDSPPVSTTRTVRAPSPQPQTTRIEIPYRKQQNIILVEATLNAMYTTHFMIDTGATYTIISSSVAENLRLEPEPETPLMTLQAASGEINAPVVNIDTIAFGNLNIPNVMAAIHDIDSSPDISGVIGLNLLNRFTMTVDASRHILILEAIQPVPKYENRNCAEARKWVGKGRKPHVQPAQEISYYTKAIALCDDLLEAYMYLAEVYYLQEQYQEAIDQYLTILRFIPDDPDAHYRLGVLYAMAGQYFQARQEFQKTLELDPDHKDAQESLEKVTP